MFHEERLTKIDVINLRGSYSGAFCQIGRGSGRGRDYKISKSGSGGLAEVKSILDLAWVASNDTLHGSPALGVLCDARVRTLRRGGASPAYLVSPGVASVRSSNSQAMPGSSVESSNSVGVKGVVERCR